MLTRFLTRRSWVGAMCKAPALWSIATGLVLVTPQLSIAQTNLAKAIKDLPIVESAGLQPDLHVPWSQLVNINDPFEGNFLAVFDRNDLQDSRSRKVISLWSHDSIRVLLSTNKQICSDASNGYFPYNWHNWGRICFDSTTASTIRQLFVKVGDVQGTRPEVDRVVQLKGENNKFAINNELATALKNAPDRNADIRLVLEGGETVDSEIGKETVKVWRSIY